MPETQEHLEFKRALLDRYLRGDLTAGNAARTSIPRHGPASTAPLSIGQQQLWLLTQLVPDMPVYNECVTIHLPGPLDVAVLEQSLNEFIRRHEIWRTSFQVVDGQPAQLIHPPFTLSLPVVDLRRLPEAERETEAVRIVTEKARALFDLGKLPLLRPILIRYDDEEHRLFLILHHIIFDGVAIYQVFLPELRKIYEAAIVGLPSPLPELPIQYSDYTRWQREYIQGDTIAKQLAYWKQQLANAHPSLELPTDRPRPSLNAHCGSMRPFALSRQLTDALKALSRREGVTLYMLMVAAFQTLLYRYTEQEDMLTGTATAGRKYAEVQKMMGFFLNTLVLRTNLSGNPPFRTVLQRVREVVLEALSNPDVPFEYLVKELQPERNLSQNPLFQTLITLEPPLPVLPSGWTLTQMDVRIGTAKFDLYLELDDRPEGLIGRFMYNTDLFDESTIERITGHWQVLLAAIIDDPGQQISDLPILTPQEQRQLLVEWNDTRAAYPTDRCVHSLFEEQAQRRPEAIALILDDQSMTYAELNRRANQLAHRLRRLGVGPDTLVGLCMDRSLEMVVALLGILKAGGAYVPLDPSYPRERLNFMLSDTHMSVLLTQPNMLDLFPTQGLEVICLDMCEASWQALKDERSDNLVSTAQSESLAYVMYTSGSTGRPKGVEIRHFSITRLVFGTDFARLDETCTLLHMSSISFDASTLEVWGTLLHGGCCVLYPERIPTPKSIGVLIRKHHVTTLWLTASLFNAVIDEAPEALRGVKQLLIGGEALSVAHVRRALELLPSTQIINGYGPTESTTFTCCYPIPRLLDETTRSIPIGSPIGNTQVYILDRRLNPVPTGVPGELYIGGAGLARGYLNRPELTSEKFIIHSFSDEPEVRLYKTGDLVRYLPNGLIEFLGRLDNQVKLRGFRIELGEIEEVLLKQPAVREAVVMIREDIPGDKRLVAYLVVAQEQFSSATNLSRVLREQLPEYMIPSAFVLLESLPLMHSGKVDRRTLPAPGIDRYTGEDSCIAPTQLIHYQLLAIWEELLQVHPIGIRDNFFDLGGHSLLAARLVARIEQICGKKLALSTLFAGPTIEQVTEALAREEGPRPRTPLVTVQAGGLKQPFFFLHGDTMGGAFYCFPLARDLGDEQPFYALEPYQFADLPVPPPIEVMVAAHIEALRAIQPEGPYLMGGFCNGALIAYEMARQLHAQGQLVDLLVLVDPLKLSRLRRLHHIAGHISELIHLDRNTQLGWFLRLRHLYMFFQRRKMLKENPAMAADDPWFTSLLPAATVLRQDYAGIFGWLTSQYVFRAYSGKTTILWAREESFSGVWKQKAEQEEQIEFRLIPGSHMTCRTEHLHGLAEQLGKCLDEVQQVHATTDPLPESVAY